MHYYITDMELEMHAAGKRAAVFLQDGCAVLDVAFDVEPGQPQLIRADPDDCQEGFDSTLTVTAIKSSTPVKFECNGMWLTIPAGEDVSEMLTPKQQAAIEAAAWKVMA